ncbi:MAG TPA: MFS transporter [Baekduia sp.]|nr:MFS transporter [Baekduia sp.]
MASVNAGAQPRYRWAILALGAFAAAAFSCFRMGLPSLGPELRDVYDLSLAQVGMIFTAVSIGVAIGLVPWGIVTDRVGERPVLSGGLALFSILMASTAFVSGFAMLLGGLFLCGLAGASATGASGRAVMGWFAVTERGTALGIRQMAIPIGGAVGSLSLPLLAGAGGIKAAFLMLAGLSMTSAICSGLWIRDPAMRPVTTGDLEQPMRDARQWRLAIASGMLAVPQAAALAFFVLFLHDERGLSVGAAAACLATIQLLGATGRIVTGRRSDHQGVRIPLLRRVSAGIAVLFCVSAALTAAPGVVLYPVLVTTGVIALSWNALAFTAAAEISGVSRAGTAMSLQGTIISIGSFTAPVAFGVFVGLTSYPLGFAVVAVFPALAVVLLRTLQEDEAQRAQAVRALHSSTRATEVAV